MFPNAAHRSAPWVVGTGDHRHHLRRAGRAGAAEHEEAGGVLVGQPLGFVVLGIFSFTQQGLDGAVYQMLNHGISTGALFMLVGYLYERRHSLEISGLRRRGDARAQPGHRFPDHDAGLASACRR